MNNNFNYSEKDDVQSGAPLFMPFSLSNDQDPESSADWPKKEFQEYEDNEESDVLYSPLPSNSPQQNEWQTNSAIPAELQSATTLSPSPPDDGTNVSPSEEQRAKIMQSSKKRDFTLVWFLLYKALLFVFVFMFLAGLVIFVTVAAIHHWSNLFFIIFCLVYGGLLAGTFSPLLQSVARRLDQALVTVEGQITRLYTMPGGRFSTTTHYHAQYRYKCNGKVYSHRDSVSIEVYRSLHIGDNVQVRCLPQHPTTSWLLER